MKIDEMIDMRICPTPPTIQEHDGFTQENDILGLRPFGERLANLVSRLDQPLVIAIDGPWGSGKTIFARQWAGLLRQRGIPVIYYDAFANDYQEDGFIALAAEVAAYSERVLGKRKKAAKSFVEKAKAVGKIITPIAVKASVRGVTAGLISVADVEQIGEGLKATLRSASESMSAAAGKVIEDRLTRAASDRAALDGFRANLAELAIALSKTTKDEGSETEFQATAPLIIIVDEMDRCRPPFAISLVEQIKHLFSVPGVVFVLVTHMPQLEAIVKGAYGADIAAATYLEKFINLRLALIRSNEAIPIQQRYIEYIWKCLGLRHPNARNDQLVRDGLVDMAVVHQVSLRTLERIMATMALVLASAKKDSYFLAPIPVVLCFMQVLRRDLFEKARSGLMKWPEVEEFLRLNQWTSLNSKPDWYQRCWRYVIETETEDSTDFDTWNYNIRRDNILPYFCRMVSDLYQYDPDA